MTRYGYARAGARMQKGDSMNRSTRGWRLGALAAFVVLVVGVIGAGAGQSARTGTERASASTLIDGTTDSVTNIDPAGQYDYGTFTLDVLTYQGLYGFPRGAKLQPVLATGCTASSNLKTWTCS